MVRFRISKGLKLPEKGIPRQRVDEHPAPRRAALVGADLFGMRAALEVSVGDVVAAGDIVFRDRRNPEITFAAPLSGQVSAIEFGPRRTLSALIIDGDGVRRDDPVESPAVAPSNRTDLRERLLQRGLWNAFRTRPFGIIPAPAARADAIVVNAVPSSALAPDPSVVIAVRPEAFRDGLASLTQLADGPVHLCRAPDAILCNPLPEGVEEAVFSGTSAVGLAGTQISRLCPAGPGRQVWSIGYQDVIAIGHLLRTGAYLAERIMSVVGPRAARPRLLRSVIGADLHAIASVEAGTDPTSSCTVISGDSLTGCEAQFLGRYDDQMTLADPVRPADRTRKLHTRLVQRSAITPTVQLERAMGIDVLPVPLMRALSVGDVDTAERLGCLELIEEDVAALSRLCTSGADYGRLLREVLDQLAVDAA
ncbi:MAG: hypothetical protein NXH97_12720 [Rhodobacteraceae bacterium]|nr:hypothetical protein [Paracoccaceae bacterium]